jgi:hypothetical protein
VTLRASGGTLLWNFSRYWPAGCLSEWDAGPTNSSSAPPSSPMQSCYRFGTIVSVACVVLLLNGCASIVKGTSQTIPVSSDPSGAEVKIDGNLVGQTPVSVKAKRKTDHLVTIEKTGYQVESVAVTRNIGGAVFGNIIAGGLIGWGVDAIDGAQWNLTPETISVALKVNTTTAPPAPPSQSSAAMFIDELNKLDAMHVAKTITDEEYARMRVALVAKYSSK